MDYLKSPHLVWEIQKWFGIRVPVAKDQIKRDGEFSEIRDYVIGNKFWYNLFVFGTALGDETFYSVFFPFWFWNIDGAVGRRVVFIWAIVMYIGQGIKDIVRWPRPGHPVIRLQNKWALEYGMPSTHAMVGVSIPFSVLIFTMNRYQYDIPLGLVGAILWCSLICVSRLYLGMHTVLDVIVGLALAVLLMVPLVSVVDMLDQHLLSNPTTPFLLLVSTILAIVYYPNSGKWTPTRGDTAMIISVSAGIYIGAWLNFQSGLMVPSELTAPYVIMWPSYIMFGHMILRTIIGFACVLLTKEVVKNATYHILCTILGQNVDNLKKSENTLQNKHKNLVELSSKYAYCGLIGLNTVYLLPQVFRLMKIERPTFFTEI